MQPSRGRASIRGSEGGRPVERGDPELSPQSSVPGAACTVDPSPLDDVISSSYMIDTRLQRTRTVGMWSVDARLKVSPSFAGGQH